MGYKIQYSPETEKKFPRKGKGSVTFGKPLFVLFAAILLIGIVTLHKHGMLWDLLIPGDPEITVAAMETMADNLKEGMSLQSAVEVFCTEIFTHAPIS